MKLYLFTISFLLFSSFSFSQNKIISETKDVPSNSEFELAISLDNTNEIAALQFDLSYDDSEFEILDDIQLEETRMDGHQVSSVRPSEGVIRVIIFSFENKNIKESEGSLLRLKFKSKTNPGSYSFNFSNVSFSSANSESISQTIQNGEITVLGAKMELDRSEINFGNVLLGTNEFQYLNIRNTGNLPLEISSSNDVLPFKIEYNLPISINPNQIYSLKVSLDASSKNEISKELYFLNNDVDTDRSSQKIILKANIYSTNIIRIGDVDSEKDVEVEVPVYIENIESFNAFQFDFLVPDGLEFVSNSISVNTNRVDNHNISVNLDDDTLRFIGFSSSNKDFIGSNGVLFSFKLIPRVNSGYFNLELSNGVITNNNLENIFTEFRNGSFRIRTPNLTLNQYVINFDSIPITKTTEKEIILSNNGDGQLMINEVDFDESNIELDIDFPLTIEPYSSKTINLKFTPNNLGEFSKYITFSNNSLEEENLLTINGVVYSPNYLKLENKEVNSNSENEINILLKNNDSVKALQFDFELPNGFNLETEEVQKTSRTEEYSIAIDSIGESKFRVIIYSLSENLILEGSGPIIKLPVFIENDVDTGDYEFDFSNIIILNENNLNISSPEVEIGKVTVINSSLSISDNNLNSNILIYPNPFSDILYINSTEKNISKLEIYSILGKRLNLIKSNFEEINTSNLTKGTYLIKIYLKDKVLSKIILKK